MRCAPPHLSNQNTPTPDNSIACTAHQNTKLLQIRIHWHDFHDTTHCQIYLVGSVAIGEYELILRAGLPIELNIKIEHISELSPIDLVIFS